VRASRAQPTAPWAGEQKLVTLAEGGSLRAACEAAVGALA
jgi:hypothetical protein